MRLPSRLLFRAWFQVFEQFEDRGSAFRGEAVDVILVVVGGQGIAQGLKHQPHFRRLSFQ